MKKLAISLVILVLESQISFATNIKSLELKCPEQIKVYSKVDKVPASWLSWDVAAEGKNAVKSLSVIAIYEGHPSKKVQLAPENADSKDNYWNWTLIPFGEKRKSPIWIACQYDDTQMLIVKSLPVKIQKCRMDFVPNSGSKKLGPIKCE